MSGFNQNLLNVGATLLGGSGTGINDTSPVILRDYNHAAKTFRTNSYERAPKLKFLFHTYFEINPAAFAGFQGGRLGTSVNSSTNFGLLVKEIKLPTFSFSTVQLNQYNRKRIIQTKIKYDPVEVTFHDDNGDIINGLWQAYYQYYYNDSTQVGSVLQGVQGGPNNSGGTKQYNNRNIYDSSISGDDGWGFSGGQSQSTGAKVPFFKNITVFGFNQHNFTAYTLVNPLVTSFAHDSYNYSEGGGTMADRMSIDYETVVYNYGNMDGKSPGNIVTGFGDPATYDTTLSPIANQGSNQYALGQGGLVGANGGSVTSPLDGLGRIVSVAAQNAAALQSLAQTNNTNNSIPQALVAGLTEALRTAPINRNTQFSTYSYGSSPGPIGTANFPTIDARSIPPLVTEDAAITALPPPNIPTLAGANVDYSGITVGGQPTVPLPVPTIPTPTPTIPPPPIPTPPQPFPVPTPTPDPNIPLDNTSSSSATPPPPTDLVLTDAGIQNNGGGRAALGDNLFVLEAN